MTATTATGTDFWVPGTPRPQGSKSYKGTRGGKPILVESSKDLPQWRRTVATYARRHFTTPADGPTAVTAEFLMPRPKAWGRLRNDPMTQRPDTDKLLRALLDAMTGIAFTDDSQVVYLAGYKRRAKAAEAPGVFITVTEVTQRA